METLRARGAYRELADGAAPTLKELTEAIHFSLGDGRIWLNDQRVVLMQSKVLGRLRQEIIDAFGFESAKALFMRVGYMQGVRDAELIQTRFPTKDLTHALAAGPRVHTLEGFVKVTTKHFEYDVEKGTYFGEFDWHDSSEAGEHIAAYGLAAEPVCWMQTGYPSGYSSFLFGRPIIFREVACAGMGADHCTVIGQNAEAWGRMLRSANISGSSGRHPAAATPGRNHHGRNRMRPRIPQAPRKAKSLASPRRFCAPGTCWSGWPTRMRPCSSSANPASARSCSPTSFT